MKTRCLYRHGGRPLPPPPRTSQRASATAAPGPAAPAGARYEASKRASLLASGGRCELGAAWEVKLGRRLARACATACGPEGAERGGGICKLLTSSGRVRVMPAASPQWQQLLSDGMQGARLASSDPPGCPSRRGRRRGAPCPRPGPAAPPTRSWTPHAAPLCWAASGSVQAAGTWGHKGVTHRVRNRPLQCCRALRSKQAGAGQEARGLVDSSGKAPPKPLTRLHRIEWSPSPQESSSQMQACSASVSFASSSPASAAQWPPARCRTAVPLSCSATTTSASAARRTWG